MQHLFRDLALHRAQELRLDILVACTRSAHFLLRLKNTTMVTSRIFRRCQAANVGSYLRGSSKNGREADIARRYGAHAHSRVGMSGRLPGVRAKEIIKH
jgi:hypothetical protein